MNQNARQFWPMRRRRQQAVNIFEDDLDWNDRIEQRLRLRRVNLNVINERNVDGNEAPPPYEY